MSDAGREALWSVSEARLPLYLFVFGVVMVVMMVMAMLSATGPSATGPSATGPSATGTVAEAVFAAASRIASVGAAAATMLISMEGLIMGATKVFFERAKERARQEGRLEGRREGKQEGRQETRRQWEAWREENVKSGRDVPELPAEPSDTKDEQSHA